MSPRLKYLLAVAGLFGFVIALIVAGSLAAWSSMAAQDRVTLARVVYANLNLLVFCTLALLAGLGWFVHLFFKAYIYAASVVREETRTILTANPSHRIDLAGAFEIQQVVHSINTLADRYQALQSEEEARIREAKADVEAEKNRLAALMSELTQSVLVCNGEGRILLYNNSAWQLFSQGAARRSSNGAGGLVGLGRSIFGIIDRNLIVHALDNIHHRIAQGDANPVSQFVTTSKGGQLVRGQMAPVRDQRPAITGFVLTMEDVTRRVERSSRRDILLRSLTEQTRSALANIRAAVETILDYPEMAPDRRNQFTQMIQEETLRLGAQLDHTLTEFAEDVKTAWLLEDMLGGDLVAALRRGFENKLEITTRVEELDEPLWLNVDSYAIVQAMTYIMSRLKSDRGVDDVSFKLKAAGRLARLDMLWHGPAIDAETLRGWEQQPSIVDGVGSPLTLQEVVERHVGEVWCSADRESQTAYLRLLLPVTEPEPGWSEPAAEVSRPEFYDFDLYHQPGQSPEWDQRLLAELTYTVFDTETTGLSPAEGDEIISIGAVRIVNGRLLRHEVFDQLINPDRPITEASIRIHGMTPQMLRGQPTIEQALPLFYQFAEDTVLVGHNAAFDMRFFQIKQAQTGLAFTQPVLDTLLLSAAAHPNQAEHSLEAIARRLGVPVIGRHTALGDAIVTGEVFLKLIPLLIEQGIRTLKDAREAAQKTYYARIKY